jgi:hypothetical protein
MSDLPLEEDVREWLADGMLLSSLSETQRNKRKRDEQTFRFERVKAALMKFGGKSAGDAEKRAAEGLGEKVETLRKRVERRRAQRRREAAAFRAKKAKLMRLGKSESDADEIALAAVHGVSLDAARYMIESGRAHCLDEKGK